MKDLLRAFDHVYRLAAMDELSRDDDRGFEEFWRANHHLRRHPEVRDLVRLALRTVADKRADTAMTMVWVLWYVVPAIRENRMEPMVPDSLRPHLRELVEELGLHDVASEPRGRPFDVEQLRATLEDVSEDATVRIGATEVRGAMEEITRLRLLLQEAAWEIQTDEDKKHLRERIRSALPRGMHGRPSPSSPDVHD